ncbi:SDR family oxidoreductase [Rhodovulum sp. YNF3179]|uniref:SDR family oxidoreductase n=1 Tax=Rhodovulum sp. YNF3179 TaxID=3425127 RepID=UPI003D34C1F7
MRRRTLLITGASTGIGAATARAAVARGWNVGLFARSAEKLAALADELGDAALVVPGDVTREADIAQAADRVAGHFDRLDAVFANAGMGLDTPGTEAGDPEEWRRMLDVNIMGVLLTTRAALPHLRETQGHLVLTGSAAGRRHIPGSIYGSSKWFVHGYAGNMAEEMAEWGGRCTVIAPGMVDTPFFDAPKPDKLQAEDVADAVLYALEADPRAAVREVFLMPRN